MKPSLSARSAREGRVKVETANGIDPPTLKTPDHFVAIGVAREKIGLIGATVLSNAHFSDDNGAKTLQVIYAWPRRSSEHQSTVEMVERAASAGPNDDPDLNRSIAERYFPDLYSYPKDWPRADPWVLLDREGRVLKAGRRVVMSGRDIQLYVESLYPGIRTDGVQVTTIHGGDGQWADVGFVWLAANSPVSELSKADLLKRNDLLVYADVIGEGKTRSSDMLVLNIGSSAVTVCSLKNPFGVVHLEVTAIEGDADAVAFRVRIQHAALGTSDKIPDAVETAWSRESPPAKVPYGGSTEIHATDQNHKAWTIVLHPERVKGARA